MRMLLGACMRILGACLWSGWVQSMRLLGACMRKLLGACMRILGASLWSGWSFSAAASLALPLLCSCCVPSLPFLLSACLLVPQASAPPWAIYTITLSRLFQFLVRLRLNSAFLGTGLVGLLVQGRLRGQGEMPGPQWASQAGPPFIFPKVSTDIHRTLGQCGHRVSG